MGVEIDFVASDPVYSTESSGGFVVTMTIKSVGLTNSTLSFIVNGQDRLLHHQSSYTKKHPIVVECHDAGIFPVDKKSITLIFINASTYIVFVILHPCDMYNVCRYPKYYLSS